MKYEEVVRESPESVEIRKHMRGFKASNEDFHSIPIEERRAGFLNMMRENYRRRPDHVIEQLDMNGVPGECIRIAGSSPERTLLYLHGGAFYLGAPETHRTITTKLAQEANAVVYVPDYRLAPEHKFPAAPEDCFASYKWLIETQKVDPEKLAVGGDSCGSNLAYATLLQARAAGLPLCAATINISPWLDLTSCLPSIEKNRDADDFIHLNCVDPIVGNYMGEHSWADPLASPLFADLKGMPPAFVQVGSTEVLLDDARSFARKSDKLGVQVELEVWKLMPHIWPINAGMMPEADEALERIAGFVRRTTGAEG